MDLLMRKIILDLKFSPKFDIVKFSQFNISTELREKGKENEDLKYNFKNGFCFPVNMVFFK